MEERIHILYSFAKYLNFLEMLIHGDADAVVPFSYMEEAHEALQENDVDVAAHARPGLGHGIDPEGIELGQQFLSRIFA